ncbi:MAG: O-antigen ligase family protein [Deltaproteobacteria bacterium]|nr:O-antigen ligase family protein [Deltaproteobacteria bacterium]
MSVLIFVLPIAHTATIRSFALFTPAILLVFRYYLAKDFRWINTSFELPFMAFFISAAASLMTSVDPHESLKEIRGELLTPILLFYISYFSVKKDSDGILLTRILFIGSLIFGIFSFYDLYNKGGSLFEATYRAGGLRDPGGGEVAGLYHTMVIPLLFWGMFYFRKVSQRSALALLLIINLIGLHVTFTRAAYLALAVQAILAGILLFRKKRWISGFVILIVIFLTGLVYTENKLIRGQDNLSKIPSLEEYLKISPEEIATNYSTDASLSYRLAIWKTAIEDISKNPFYPHGYGRFLFGKAVRNDKNKHFIHPQTHNTFIGVFFELGIQGFLIFLWMIGTFAWVCWRYWVAAKEDMPQYFSASLITMMAGYWVNNFLGSFDGDDSKLLFMMLLGIGMAVMRRLPKENELLKQRQ